MYNFDFIGTQKGDLLIKLSDFYDTSIDYILKSTNNLTPYKD